MQLTHISAIDKFCNPNKYSENAKSCKILHSMYINEFRGCQKLILFEFSYRIFLFLRSTKYVITLKTRYEVKKVRHDVQNTARRQKVHHDVQNTVMTSKHVIKSKTRHDVQKYVMTSKTRNDVNKMRHDVQNTS